MISKQDMVAARTPADLERRYNLRKSFGEAMNLATDARKAAEEADRLAQEAAEALKGLNQEEIFRILTNNGEAQGVFRGEDGQIYINASYIAAGVLSSVDGKIQINLVGGEEMPVFNTGISTNGLTVRSDEAGAPELFKMFAHAGTYGDHYVGRMIMNSATGGTLLTVTESMASDYSEPVGISAYFNNLNDNKNAVISTDRSYAGFRVRQDGNVVGSLLVGPEGRSQLRIDKINEKTVSWKDNGDGTYTLIGK